MTEQEPPEVAAPQSRFIIGSVSEENSEDEILSLGKERSLSPASVGSDSLSDLGLNHIDGLAQNMR